MTYSVHIIKKLWSLFVTRAFILMMAISFFFLASCQTTQTPNFETKPYITNYVSYEGGRSVALPFSKPIIGGYSGNVEALHELDGAVITGDDDRILSKALLRDNLNNFVGCDDGDLNKWLGAPSLKRRDADIRIYQYHTPICIADIFAQEVQGRVTVKDIILRFPTIVQGHLGKGEATAQEQKKCVSSLLQKRAKPINI